MPLDNKPPFHLDPTMNKLGLEGAKAASDSLVNQVNTGPRGWGSRTMWASVAFSATCTAGLFLTGNVSAENLGMCLAPLTAWIAGEKWNDAAHASK